MELTEIHPLTFLVVLILIVVSAIFVWLINDRNMGELRQFLIYLFGFTIGLGVLMGVFLVVAGEVGMDPESVLPQTQRWDPETMEMLPPEPYEYPINPIFQSMVGNIFLGLDSGIKTFESGGDIINGTIQGTISYFMNSTYILVFLGILSVLLGFLTSFGIVPMNRVLYIGIDEYGAFATERDEISPVQLICCITFAIIYLIAAFFIFALGGLGWGLLIGIVEGIKGRKKEDAIRRAPDIATQRRQAEMIQRKYTESMQKKQEFDFSKEYKKEEF